jgi:hypothetical protein
VDAAGATARRISGSEVAAGEREAAVVALNTGGQPVSVRLRADKHEQCRGVHGLGDPGRVVQQHQRFQLCMALGIPQRGWPPTSSYGRRLG